MDNEEDHTIKDVKNDSGRDTPNENVISDHSSSSSPNVLELEEDITCQLCQEKYHRPRILSCLHVFCTGCLEKQVEDCNEGNEGSEAENAAAKMGIIQCSVCSQNTLLPRDGVQGLPLDDVLSSLVDANEGDDVQILCTSCKAQEKAVAQCSDCANFLCPGCVTAHQFMRCFENHKVDFNVLLYIYIYIYIY